MQPPADWQLPDGVDRGLWSYLHDDRLARGYDEGLRDCPLVHIDLAFVERHCRRPGRLVDLGCGTGRTLLAMAARGHRALGVDLSAQMLRVAGEKSAAAGLPVQRLQANLVDLGCLADGSFDHAVCLFSTLGMVRGAANRRRVIGHAHRVLRPGGRFVLHVHNRWFNFWNRPARGWAFRQVLLTLARSPGAGDSRMPAHDGQAALTLHLFTRREAAALLRGAGFRLLEVEPVSLRSDGRLSVPWLLAPLRAYGYLIAAEKPA